jgi:TonB-linked SusC/RagA family outer membrane protein
MTNITSGKPPCTGKRRVWHQTWMIMRLTAFLIIISTLSISAKSYSQKVNLLLHNVPVEQVFRQIREQTGYSFLWAQQTLKDLPLVSVSIHDGSLKDAVKSCLKGLPLTYGIRGNVVYIERKIVTPVAINPSVRSPILPLNVVVGLVTDSTGSPLPGVTVYVKGNESIGTATDENGRYVLEIPDNATLVFTMIGFERQEIPVQGKSAINVILHPSSNTLGETVVVAFGTQKKEDVVGAITTIDPKDLKVPSSNLTTALAGRLAGIIAYQRSGEPGKDNAQFFIRGVTTFGHKTDPLILIDGVEATTTDLARLQPDDIASFSILKDAASTALYGSRAANGVLMVTTKQGHEGKAKYFIRVENSMSSPTKDVQLADPITYMKAANEAVLARNPLGILPYSNRKIESTVLGKQSYLYPATDWMKTLFKDHTMNQRANINVSGGGSIAQYYLSGTFNQDHGVLKVPKIYNYNNNIDLKTYSVRSNVTIRLNKLTSVALKLTGRFEDYTGPLSGGTAVYNDVIHTNPVLFPPYYAPDPTNTYTKHILFGNYEIGNYNNPYADMVKGYKNYSSTTLKAQINLKQDLSFVTKGLSLDVMAYTNRYAYFDVSRSYNPFWYDLGSFDDKTGTYMLNAINPDDGTEYLSYTPGEKTVSSMVYLQGIFNYHRTFNDKHTFSGTLVYYMQNQLSGQSSSLQTSLPSRNLGVSGRATYTFRNRLNAEFNFGANGSERFSKSHRFGFFPAFGVSWNISNESFWQDVKPVINNLKIRATYGLVGNDQIGSAEDRFFYLSEVNLTDGGKGATFGQDYGYSQPGVTVNRYANSNITWEIAHKIDLGVDLGLWNDVTINADYYRQVRTNILMTRASIPASVGLGTVLPRANVGAATNEGIDGSIQYNKSINQNFWIQGRANFTYAHSAYHKYEEPNYGIMGVPWLSRVGYSLSQNWGYVAEHLFIDDKEVLNSPKQNFGDYEAGDIKYMDINGDGQITTLDQVPIGYPASPEIVYGFGFSMGYKGFDFSGFFQGLARESFWIDASATSPFQGQTQYLQVYADSHWSKENQDIYAVWPRLSPDINQNNVLTSTWWMRNGEFLRLKQVELGYSLSQEMMKRWHMNNVRIYLNATNLFAFSHFKLWDVEMAGDGLGYPVQRVMNIGFTTSF